MLSIPLKAVPLPAARQVPVARRAAAVQVRRPAARLRVVQVHRPAARLRAVHRLVARHQAAALAWVRVWRVYELKCPVLRNLIKTPSATGIRACYRPLIPSGR